LTLLAQNVDDIEGRTSSQSNGDKLDRLRASISGSIVDDDVVPGTTGSYKLAMRALGLGKSYNC